MIITREQIAGSGKVSLGEFLQPLPEQGNAINTGVNFGGDGSTRVGLGSRLGSSGPIRAHNLSPTNAAATASLHNIAISRPVFSLDARSSAGARVS